MATELLTRSGIRRAILSVYDKTGILELAQFLHGKGVELISTGGTYRTLVEGGVPVIEMSHHTGCPEMMDGRVKTLHPKVHGGLLAERDKREHLADAKAHGIPMIDLVVVNLYPFEQTADRPNATPAQKIEQIDIGGPSMLRSGAKNHHCVTVVTDPADYDRLRREMELHQGGTSPTFRAACARKAFRLTSRYDALVADELTALAASAGTLEAGELLPEGFALPLRKVMDLRYGENPHQQAACYEVRTPGLGTSLVRARNLGLGDKELSFNNLMDADAAWRLVNEFSPPACAIIKHANPCGCAVASELNQAFRLAYDGDPQAAFGCIVAFNRPIDLATAQILAEPGRFVEIIIGPEFSESAREVLTTAPKWRKTVRLLATGPFQPLPALARTFKPLVGGMLVQEPDRPAWDPARLNTVTRRSPTPSELADLEVAWLTVKHVSSNAITVVRQQSLVGVGAGQMSRVNSVWIATTLAGERAKGAVLGSDAFFPFPDSVTKAAAAGITAIIQPGGSKGDEAVIAEADRHGLAMVFTGIRHFRH